MKHLVSCLIAVLCISSTGLGQTDQVYRASQEENHVFGKINAISIIHIHAEQTNINIIQWDKPFVDMVILNTSSHEKEEVARAGLDRVKFHKDEIGKNLYIRKLVTAGQNNGGEVPRIFSELTMMVPGGVEFRLKNKVGRITVESGNIDLNGILELCQLIVTRSSINLNVSQSFGEVKISDSQIRGELKLNRVNATLSQVQGSLKANTRWGSLVIDPTQSSLELTASIDKTEMSVRGLSLEKYQLDINSKSSRINVSPALLLDFAETETGKTLSHFPANPSVKLNIESDNSEINLQN